MAQPNALPSLAWNTNIDADRLTTPAGEQVRLPISHWSSNVPSTGAPQPLVKSLSIISSSDFDDDVSTIAESVCDDSQSWQTKSEEGPGPPRPAFGAHPLLRKQNTFMIPVDPDTENHFEAEMWTVAAIACAMLWVAVVTLFLVLPFVLYRGNAVEEACGQYAEACASRVASQAAQLFAASLRPRDALHGAILRNLYVDPLDYRTVRGILEPVFLLEPMVRSVDLAFNSQVSGISVRRSDDVTLNGLTIQSDADDCFSALGARGCSSMAPALEQAWYHGALSIPVYNPEAAGVQSAITEEFRWEDAPGFILPRFPSELSRAPWAPAYALLFRVLWPGSRGSVSLIGRVTLEVASENLLDGCSGSVAYICDRSGNLVAAVRGGELVLPQASGQVLRRRAWDLDAPWADQLDPSHFSTHRAERRLVVDGWHIVLTPMQGRGMSHFTVLFAIEDTLFVDGPLNSFGLVSIVLAVSPVFAGIVILIAWCVHRDYVNRIHIGRVRATREGIFAMEESKKTLKTGRTSFFVRSKSVLKGLRRSSTDISAGTPRSVNSGTFGKNRK